MVMTFEPGDDGNQGASPKPVLYLPAHVLRSLADKEQAHAILAQHFRLEAFGPATGIPERALAEAAARRLRGLVVTSHIDGRFAPCVLAGADVTGPGVTILQATEQRSASALLHDVIDLGPVEHYLTDDDLAAYGEVAQWLEEVSPVRQLRLGDGVCTLLLTLARTDAASPGVLTIRIDT